MHRGRPRRSVTPAPPLGRRRAAAAAAPLLLPPLLLSCGLLAPVPAAAQQQGGWSPPPAVKTLPPGTGPAATSPSRPEPPAATPHAAVSALPATIAGFSRGNITDFEPRSPGLGASARYTLPGRDLRADFYLYDRNLRQPITEDIAAGPVRDEFGRAVQDRPGTGRRDYSLACVAGAGGRFAKVRLTMPEAADAPEIARRFAHAAVLAARGGAVAPATGGTAPPPSGAGRPGGKTP